MLAQPPLWFIVIAFLCAIGPLVFFHELGHYWVARLVRRRRRAILDRLRAGDRRLDRQARHALEGRLAAARRLCPVRRRHEPGQPARPRRGRAAGSRGQQSFHLKPVVAAIPDRAGRAVANFLLAIAIFAAFFAASAIPNTAAGCDGDRRRKRCRAGRDPDRATGSSASPAERIEPVRGFRRIVSIRPDAAGRRSDCSGPDGAS